MYSTGYHDKGTPKVESAKDVTLEIDGQTVTVPEGTSIMRAAALTGPAGRSRGCPPGCHQLSAVHARCS